MSALIVHACARQPFPLPCCMPCPACAAEAERTPVWLMRQAGRYMAAFREYSDRIPFRERSETASIAIELSLQVCHAWPAPPADGPVCRARHTCHCSRAAALVAHRQLWMSAGP